MEQTQHEAKALLKDAAAIETAVRARAPQEHPLYVALGLTTFLIGLAVDLNSVDGVVSAAGATAVVLAVAVTVGTNIPYLRRYRQVRARSTPIWLEWALGLWSAVAVLVLGKLLDSAIDFSFTLGGVVGGVPFLLWARQLRRNA